MVQIRRDGESIRIVLVDPVTTPEVVEEVRRLEVPAGIADVIIELPDRLPNPSIIGEVIRDVSAEALAHGATVRYSL